MKIKLKHKGKEYKFTIQEMTPLDYYNEQTKLRLGQIDFKTFTATIIKECIAEPVQARDIKYFEQIPRILDVIVGKIGEISDVGLEEKLEIEIEE